MQRKNIFVHVSACAFLFFRLIPSSAQRFRSAHPGENFSFCFFSVRGA
ncbi:hypothetical protein CLOLEP_03291 [[Clostridium] leptum DSM 753]|uniref:Uncharacterized protein n=1 Tax=[Clostridium] leptum DSM 753 TaxID=428125 RepID=A7VXG6_9FIRM|nr:hypothetical protein CLOLEP_03291 [[Clostridium] leptum DSM 753]